MSNGPNLKSSMEAGNLPGLAVQSKCANKSNRIRGAIVAAIVALILPSTALADDEQDCEKGRAEVRIAACSNVLESDPSNFQALANRGAAYSGTGEFGRGLADLNEAFQHAPSAALAFLYVNRGTTQEGLGNHTLAIADFSEAVRRDPRLTVVAYFGRAIAYEATGQVELAKADIGGAIKRDRILVASLYMHRGDILRGAHQYDKAIAAFDKSIDLTSNFALAYFGRGASYQEKGNLKLAAADYQKCLEFKAHTELVRQRQQLAREQLEKLNE
jgi:tetratricopeptide (TPR) repeat protein